MDEEDYFNRVRVAATSILLNMGIYKPDIRKIINEANVTNEIILDTSSVNIDNILWVLRMTKYNDRILEQMIMYFLASGRDDNMKKARDQFAIGLSDVSSDKLFNIIVRINYNTLSHNKALAFISILLNTHKRREYIKYIQ